MIEAIESGLAHPTALMVTPPTTETHQTSR